MVEVSDISSGKLTPTVVYTSKTSINSSNVMLSPDETVLYVVNTEGASVTALFFDKTTGKLSAGCTSGAIRGQSADWSYLAGLALISQTGNGGGVYVAEFGDPSAIAIVRLESSGREMYAAGRCRSRRSRIEQSGVAVDRHFSPSFFLGNRSVAAAELLVLAI